MNNQARDPWWAAALLRFVDVVAWLTPARRRAGWKAEWKAEVIHAVRERRAATRDGPEAGRIGRWTASALADALWLRGEELTMERWADALRFAGRTLRRSPAFTSVAVLTLGLGIGATTAIFSLANWALLRPVPGVQSPGELLVVVPRPAGDPTGIAPLSDPTVRRLMAGGPTIAAVAAYSGIAADVVLGEGSEPLRVRAQVVTPGFFATLGVGPWRGRVFEDVEGEPTSVHAVAVVSHDFWRGVLSSEPDAVGQTLDANGSSVQVVGIAPPGFRGPERTDDVALWFPSSAVPAVMARVPANILTLEGVPLWGSVVARRGAAATTEAVAAQLTAAAPELARRDVRLEITEGFGIHPTLRARLTDTLALVGGLVSLLLVLTVANLVNLVLSRVARRRREVVIRKALGASSSSITAALATEGVVLAVFGSVAALMIGFGLVRVLDGATLMEWMPVVRGVPLDARVMAFALGMALAVTATASYLAATGVQRLAPVDALRSSHTATTRSGRLRRTMVALQVALSLSLLVGAGLLVQSVTHLQGEELGLLPTDVVVFSLNPGVQGYSDDDADRLFRELAAELDAEPGIRSVGFSWLMPFGPRSYSERVRRPDTPSEVDEVVADANMITPAFFSALGIRLVDGRTYDEREYGQPVRPDRGAVVINRTLAEQLFPDGGAVGRNIVMPGRRESAFEVIGVVEDARLKDPRESPGPMLFDPFGNGYKTTSASFVASIAGNPDIALARIREMVRTRDSRLPLLEAGQLGEIIRSGLAEDRALARITSSFALLSLLLAAAGLFALVSELSQSRVREFGVRRALGAGAARLASLVLRDSLLVVGSGALVGILLGYVVASMLESRLAGVGAVDLFTFAAATCMLLVVAVLASLQPALRSARVDPVKALMTE